MEKLKIIIIYQNTLTAVKIIVHILDGENKIIIFSLVVSLSTVNAHAYIDPGTGAFIVQTLIAVGATIVFYLGWPIRFLKSLFSKKKKKKV